MTTIYVDQATGASGNSGTTGSPYASVATALSALESAGTPGTIVVEGTYTTAGITLTSADSGDVIEGGTITAATAAQAIDLDDASNVILNDITISAADGDAVLVDGGAGNIVQAVTVTQAGIAGVEVKDGAVNTTINQSYLTNLGADETNPTSGGGIWVHGATNTQITSNSINDAQTTGIALTDFAGLGAGYSTAINGALVEGNYISNTGLSTSQNDYGAIYDEDRSDDLQAVTIADNYISNVNATGTAHAEAIYLDDDSSGVTVTGNTVTGFALVDGGLTGLNANSNAVQIHGGSENIVQDNTFDMGTDPNSVIYLQQPATGVPVGTGEDTPFTNTTITDNIVESTAASPSGSIAYYDSETLPTSLNISGNYYPSSSYPLGTPADTDPLVGAPNAYGVMSAAEFQNTEGVNATGGTQSYYINQNVADIQYLGISNVRLGILDPSGYGDASILQIETTYGAAGIRIDAVDQNTDHTVDPSGQLAIYDALEDADPGELRLVEGANEINIDAIPSFDGMTDSTGPDELAIAQAYQSYIYGQITSDPTLTGVDVVGFTGFDTPNFDGTDTNIAGSSELAAGAANYDVTHIYPGSNGNAPPGTVTLASAFPDLTTGQLLFEQEHGHLIVSEEGFQPSVGTLDQAQYYLDSLLQNAKQGVAVTYLYSVDGPGGQDLFGPTDPSAPTLAATAIHNLNAILSAGDTGAAAAVPVAAHYSVSGEATGYTDLELTETNGDSDIILYNQSGSTDSETVTFADSSDVSVYDPITGTSPVSTYSNVTSITLSVTGDPLILDDHAAVSLGSGPDSMTFTVYAGDITGDSFFIGIGSGGAPTGAVTPYETVGWGYPETVTVHGTFSGTESFGVVASSGEAVVLQDVIDNGVTVAAGVTATSDGVSFDAAVAAPSVIGSGPDSITLVLSGTSENAFYVGVQSGGAPDGTTTHYLQVGAGAETITVEGTFVSNGSIYFGLNVESGTIDVHSAIYQGVTTTFNTEVSSATDSTGFYANSAINITPYATPATSGLLATPLETYNWNPGTQLTSFLSAYDDGTASIAFIGDSTTSGIGADPTGTMDIAGSFPSETAYWLNQDGVVADDSTFLGNNAETENQIALTGNATQNILGIAGDDIQMVSHGDSFTFTPNSPISGNEIQANVLNNFSGDTVSVTVNGTLSVGTITIPTSGTFDQFLNETFTMPSVQQVNNVTFTVTSPNQTGSSYLQNAVYFEGAGVTSTAEHSIEIYNDGAAGIQAEQENYQYTNGPFYTTSSGVVPATAELDPSLVVIDLGINDFIQQPTIDATTVLNDTISAIGSIISVFQANGEDVILASPTPFDNGSSAPTTATQAAFVSALETLAVADHVGMIDLNDTYGASLSGLAAAGGISSSPGGVHPSAQLYANIGQGIGSLIAAAVHTYA